MKEYDVRNLACPGPVLKLRGLLEEGEREIRFWVADDLCRSNVTRFAASREIATEVDAREDGSFRRDLPRGRQRGRGADRRGGSSRLRPPDGRRSDRGADHRHDHGQRETTSSARC